MAEVTGRLPVLAVTAADATGPSRPVTARLRLLEPNASSVVVLPFVRRWRELAAPLDEARVLLAVPRTDLPRPLRRYAASVDDVVAALLGRHPPPLRPVRGPVARTAPTLRRP